MDKRKPAGGGIPQAGRQFASDGSYSSKSRINGADLERIREALGFLDPTDRDTWLRVGMAIKSEVGEAGFHAWDEWSQRAESYNAADARDVWKSCKPNGGIGPGTLYHLAREHGWRPNGTHYEPAPEEREARRQESEARAAADQAEIEHERSEAARKATEVWNAARTADGNPYLERKGAMPTKTLRQIEASEAAKILGYMPQSRGEILAGRLLVVPVKVGEALSTLELIAPDRAKTALRGRGTKQRGFWASEALPEGDGTETTLLIGEGVATVLSAREATGHPAVAALSSGNLGAVARTMRDRYPQARLILLADLVKATGEPDPHAIEAARKVRALVAVPAFGFSREPRQTDFNDMAQEVGLGAVREAIEAARRPTEVTPAPDHRGTPAGDSGGLSVTRADTLTPEPVDWLWDGWLARGKVHVLAGAPGTGKTSLALAMAATLTVGGRWPDGARAEVGEVLIWSGEDDPTDTLVPRLIACGANLSRIHFIGSVIEGGRPRAFDPAQDAQLLQDHVATMDPRPALLIVDPIVSAVAGDSHKNAEVRRALQPLVDLAQVRRCAVLGVSHFSKGTQGRDPVDRVTGSLAFGALARVVLATAKLPDEEGGGRILARAKNNLGPDTGGFGYDLEPLELPDHPGVFTTRVAWGEALDGTARELLSRAEAQDDPEQRSATSEAVDWLREHLKDGPCKAKDVQREAKDAGISEKSLRTARERLGVKPVKAGFSGGWQWELPPEDAHAGPKMPKMPKITEQENLGTLGTFGAERASSDGDDWGEDIV